MVGRKNRRLLVARPEENLYKGKIEQLVAEEFNKMMAIDLGRLLVYSSHYNPYVLVPDYSEHILKGTKKEMILRIYIHQEIEKIGSLDHKYIMTRYSFNPKSKTGLILPDVETFYIAGELETKRKAVPLLEKFFEERGWKVHTEDALKIDAIDISPNCARFQNDQRIVNPAKILTIAEKELGYNRDKLYF